MSDEGTPAGSGSSKAFDASFKYFPPDLRARLWVLGLDANTNRVNIAYQPGNNLNTSVEYKYGSSFAASMAVKGFTASGAYDFGNRQLALSAGWFYQGFRFESTAIPQQRSVGVKLSYGRTLLPFPDEMLSVFNDASSGLASMAGDISSAPNNPLSWYKLHSNDFSTIGQAVDLGKRISEASKDKGRFGVEMRLNYTPATGLVIYGGGVFWF